ncbi:MAG TPA: hypothetical protein VGH14_20345 [Solirubrobacterales bacterium]|jgi:Tfp pilus assembly protein PilW
MRELRQSPIADEQGLTLVELLVASVMSLIIVGAAMTMLISAVRDQPKITERADQVGRARTVSEQMLTELRQGVKLETRERSKVVFVTYVHASSCTSAPSSAAKAIKCRVTYSCATSGACTRSVLNEDGSGTARTTTLVSGISNPTEVFCYMPSTEAGKCGIAKTTEPTTYVGVKLQFPNDENRTTTTLENGATLRNATLGF